MSVTNSTFWIGVGVGVAILCLIICCCGSISAWSWSSSSNRSNGARYVSSNIHNGGEGIEQSNQWKAKIFPD